MRSGDTRACGNVGGCQFHRTPRSPALALRKRGNNGKAILIDRSDLIYTRAGEIACGLLKGT
jgi:hypothetical protein